MADQVKEILARIKAQQSSQANPVPPQFKKSEPTIPPLPQEAEEEEAEELEEEMEAVPVHVPAMKPKAQNKPQQVPLSISEEDIAKINNEIAKLQNDGIFRLELLIELRDIASTLKKMTGGQ